jgi:hypothetical protein
MAQAPSDSKDNKIIDDTVNRIYKQIEDMFSEKVKLCTTGDTLDTVLIITHAMLLLSDITSLSGIIKKEIVIKVVHTLLNTHMPEQIKNDPAFPRLYLEPIDKTIDTIYWVSLQGKSFFKKSGCCGCF